MHHTKPLSSLRDLKSLWIEPGIEMPGYCHRVAPRRPNANCPNRPSQNECRKRVFKCGMRPSSLPSSLPPASDFGETSRYDAASCFDAARSASQFDFRPRPASCASPCEIMPAPRLPIVSAVFHRASHATSCPCGNRNAALA
jgi:hypothetical protein